MSLIKKPGLVCVLLLIAFQVFSQKSVGDHLQIGLHIDPMYSNSKVIANAGGEAIKKERDKYEKAKLALTVGYSVSYVVSKKLKFSIGGYYTNPGEKDVRNNSSVADTSGIPAITVKKVRSYKYFGVPFQITYYVIPPWRRDWLLCFSGGLCAEKFYDAKEKIITIEDNQGTTVKKDKLSMNGRGRLSPYALSGYFGAGYERSILNRKVQLCVMPYYKYYFTTVFETNNGATNSRLKNIGLNLSVSYRLSRKMIR